MQPGYKVNVLSIRGALVMMVSFLALTTSYCGGWESDRFWGRGQLNTMKNVNDISDDMRAAAAVAAQTETENGRAPGACVEILFTAAQDVFVNVSSETEVQKMQAAVCSLDEQQMASMLQESHRRKGTRSNGFGLLIDALTEFGKNKIDLNYNHTDSHLYSDELARLDASHVRHVYCNNQAAESFKSQAVESFKSVASEVTLDKYNACVRARSYGLRCETSTTEKMIAATVRWEPTELVRSYLPRVALDWSGLVNLSAQDSLPRTLGIGSGVSVGLVRTDKNADSAIGVTASDRSGKYSFTCNIALPVKTLNQNLTMLRRDPSCGVESFKEALAPECGVSSYKLARSQACGPELLKEERSALCGIERYNARHDCGLCGQSGVIGGCRKCEHPAFGVAAYRSCRHVDHGVERFAECRHPQHGVETYNKCRREEFGVELFKECHVAIESDKSGLL